MSFFEKVLKGLRGRPPSDDERRRNGRLPAHGQVLMVWQNTLGRDRRTSADIIEMSAGGLSVRTLRAVPVGREAGITNGRIVLSCIVRHCERVRRECTMGLEIVSSDDLPEDSPYRHPFSDVELSGPES